MPHAYAPADRAPPLDPTRPIGLPPPRDRDREQLHDNQPETVCLALFLYPHKLDSPPASCASALLGWGIEHFQPHPSMWHVELIVPNAPKGRRLFATYIGDAAAYRGDARIDTAYYESKAGHWCALPVRVCGRAQAEAAHRALVEACDRAVGTPYSLFRYATSLWGVRRLAAPFLSSEPGVPGHCANVTARLVATVGAYAPVAPLRHSPSTYGPASMYAEMLEAACAERDANPPPPPLSDEQLGDVESLRGRSDAELRRMSAQPLTSTKWMWRTIDALAQHVDCTTVDGQRELASVAMRVALNAV